MEAPASEAVQRDRAALVALYAATDGENWDDNSNWLSDAPLGDWYGVTTRDCNPDLASALAAAKVLTLMPELTPDAGDVAE